MFQDDRLVHPPHTNGQSINPIRPEMVTIIGSEILYRHKIPKLISATIAVVRSVIARTPNTITAPVIAPVAAAVAPSTNALSWALSRWRLNHGAGTTVNTYTGKKIPIDAITAPAMPATRKPMKATVMTTGPGVIIATATASRN